MNKTGSEQRQNEWLNYYERFAYFSADTVRDGCYPRIMEHENTPQKAIVLVHGLTDSPYFMTAIAEFFFRDLGFNVYLPLLHCHGLRQPKGMESVELEEWKANVGFAISTAAAQCDEVSVGGLSTGGTISFYMAATNPKIHGSLYLFSAALDLAGGRLGLIGEAKELLLRTFLADLLDKEKPLIGENPYRYGHIDMDGAQELARLMKETDNIIEGFSPKDRFPKRVFAAHSECDTTANIDGIETLHEVCDPNWFRFVRIPENEGVSHASVVLESPISSNGRVLEKANPHFESMMQSLATFANV